MIPEPLRYWARKQVCCSPLANDGSKPVEELVVTGGRVALLVVLYSINDLLDFLTVPARAVHLLVARPSQRSEMVALHRSFLFRAPGDQQHSPRHIGRKNYPKAAG